MKKILIGAILFTPAVIFANTHIATKSDGLSGFLTTLTGLANQFYTLLLVLIIAAFAWGVMKFVFQSGDDQEKGRNMMIWSIVAITVLFSIWGIVKIFQETLGLDSGSNRIAPPTIPTVTR